MEHGKSVWRCGVKVKVPRSLVVGRRSLHTDSKGCCIAGREV